LTYEKVEVGTGKFVFSQSIKLGGIAPQILGQSG
jgi:hypothetical protein